MDGLTIQKLINLYSGQTLMFDVDYSLINRGDGIEIIDWVSTIQEPTITQLQALLPQLEIKENNELIKKQIVDIEAKQDRTLRDFALGVDVDGAQARLLNIENEIQVLRGRLRAEYNALGAE